ncbi:MAG: STAS domain-containing protein [Armatimonadetes bacterium]|nr:STAS domain-containing protein [Armatimonadota bacterium]
MDFKVNLEYDGEMPVVIVTGDLDFDTSPHLAKCLQQLIESNHTTFCVDLTSVEYMDSEGLKALIKAYHELKGQGKIQVRGTHGSIRRIFEISGLHKLFDIK